MLYKVTTEHTDLRIREQPTTDSRIIGGLPRGSLVEVERSIGRWMKLVGRGWAYAGDHGQFLTLVAPSSGAPSSGLAVPSPGHTLIFFGGFSQDRIPGQPLTGGTSSDRACRDILQLALWDRFIAVNPALSDSMDNNAINSVLNSLRNPHDFTDRDRTGTVVVYGFSAGGFNALRLCQRISRERDSRLPTRINLLITVDPCIQDLLGLPPPPNWFQGLDRRTPSIVRYHINYYQSAPNPRENDRHCHGCPMPWANEEQDLRPTPHDSMPDITLCYLQAKIRKSLSSNVNDWGPEWSHAEAGLRPI